jgi:Amt family ammonium transporter
MFAKIIWLGLLVLSPHVLAADTPLNTGNTAWILTATALVLFMSLPGLALFYAGLVRSKNVLSILVQCFAIAAMISLLWLIGLYSLAFTDGGSVNHWLGGTSRLLMAGLNKDSMTGDIPEVTFAAFQMTFAIITPALIIGAFAERMKFASVLVFSALWTLTVYVPVAHWVWGGGYFFQHGLIDFAGGTVVHITAGIAALVCALVLGARKGFGKVAMPPHNLTMTITGAGMLWVGWYGFNGGSALAANGSAGMALFVTHIAASAGALAWMACEWIKFGKPSGLGIVTGVIAGLGTITGASGVVGPAGALVIGLLAGVICFFMTQLIKKTLKIDDSLDVFPVHGVGGILGTFLAGIFCSPDLGVFSGFGYAAGHESIGSQLSIQMLGIVVIGVYTAVLTWILLKVTAVVTGGLRVNEDEEREGLDLVAHDERGYDIN